MLHFIYNPCAGKGKAERCRKVIEARMTQLNVAHYFHETSGRKDAEGIARCLTADTTDDVDIVAMGGDGTLNEVLNGIEDPSRVRLGLIPCGSGNDFAAAAGIPDTPEEALNILLHGEAKFTDYLECSGVRGINAIGTGIDVDILRRYARMKVLKGSAAYLAALILTVLKFQFYHFSETVDGLSVPHAALIACAANGQSIGGGIPINPGATIDDGQLDIVIIDNIRKISIPRAFICLMRRRILSQPYTVHRRADRLSVQSDKPMPIQIDGEIYDNLPFDVRIVSHRLRMYRP